MSLLYTYGTGSSYESKRWDSVQNLLNQLEDNNTNLIFANHVRDAVFTLWERVNEVAITAASASTLSPYFQNSNPTTLTVGGIKSGTTFPTQKTVQQMFNSLLYPYVSPILSFSTLSDKEYGSSNTVNLSWSVNKGSNSITSILVDNQIISPNGGSQSDTKTTTGSYSIPVPVSTINTYIITVSDDIQTISTTTSFNWMNKIYWGKITSHKLSLFSSTSLLSLDGAGVGTGNQLSTTKNKTYNGINGQGEYLVFAWPSSVVGATTPLFTVNGIVNTAFYSFRSNWSFVNSYGLTASYEVWVSNTVQNSPLNITIS